MDSNGKPISNLSTLSLYGNNYSEDQSSKKTYAKIAVFHILAGKCIGFPIYYAGDLCFLVIAAIFVVLPHIMIMIISIGMFRSLKRLDFGSR